MGGFLLLRGCRGPRYIGVEDSRCAVKTVSCGCTKRGGDFRELELCGIVSFNVGPSISRSTLPGIRGVVSTVKGAKKVICFPGKQCCFGEGHTGEGFLHVGASRVRVRKRISRRKAPISMLIGYGSALCKGGGP